MKVVALLRGINVGGHKKIRMAELRALFEELGFTSVATYIQSGNVIFESGDLSEADLIERIGQGIERTFGFQVPIIVRSQKELARVIAASPFGQIDPAKEGTRYSVSFLAKPPVRERVDAIGAFVKAPEELVVQGREVYLHCPNGTGASRLTPTFLESKLAVTATTRNWRSLLKLAELST